MSIAVVCPGCKAQFRVSDQFAGKTGPCPKCKATITVPALEAEVKIHAPEETAPKDSKGRAISKPIPRVERKFNPKLAVAIAGGTLAVLIVAWMAGRIVENKHLLAGIGLTLFSFPLVVAGYEFLREDEAEPYRGRELWLRSSICAVLYALLWVAFWFVPAEWIVEYWSWFYIAIPFAIAGATAAFATLDLEFGAGFFHYSFYLAVTILLRYTIGLPLLYTATTG
jgi:predicted Zn finger-like uncharacterized protein